MDHRDLFVVNALVLDINDVRRDAPACPEPVQRVRRQGAPSERHLSLARNLQRDVWQVLNPDEKASRVEVIYGLQENRTSRNKLPLS